MLNNIMNIINGLEEKDLSNGISAEDINKFGFILLRNDFILAMIGIPLAGMFMATKEMVGKNNVPMIIVNDNFYELNEETRSFIIAHELGHYQYHEAQYNGYVRNIKDEFEADEFAVGLVGLEAAINGIRDLKNSLLDLCYEPEDENVVETDIRIENLINKFMVTC